MFQVDDRLVGLLRDSGLFEEDWYETRYRDVSLSRLGAFRHFVAVGWMLDRAPSRRFSPNLYYSLNPDVALSGLKALTHYLLYGANEGRAAPPIGPTRFTDPNFSGESNAVGLKSASVLSPPHIVVNGIQYSPIGRRLPRIGIGISTRNRPEISHESIREWRRFLPRDATLVVVDDASDRPVPEADFRFSERVGIARAKNKCLQLLHAAGIEHFFLSDDDTYPISPEWWVPYVESPEPHLMYIFEWPGGPPIVAQDSQHIAWAHPCGPMLYLQRSALDAVGGFDPAYGLWGHEHVDLSNRIHNAGLTTWRFADVVGSEKLIYCKDQHGIERSVSDSERAAQLVKNVSYYEQNINSKAYIEFREPRRAVLASWLHAPDPQRGGSLSYLFSDDAAQDLKNSILGADMVLFSDDFMGDERVDDLGLGVYLSRWIHWLRWLREHEEVQWVWCVDANDVTMLREPWEEMVEGVLYCGWEPGLVDSPWMREMHPALSLQSFMDHNGRQQLLNCGVVGGDRKTMLEFLAEWPRVIEENAQRLWEGSEIGGLGLDMGPFNSIAYDKFRDRIRTGIQVTTLFKRYERNDYSWWMHK